MSPQFHVLAWRVTMSPMPSYNMDNERLSPSPLHSPGEILSPREIKGPRKSERVVTVSHVKDVINRVIVDVRLTPNNLNMPREKPIPQKEKEGYITSSDMEIALQKMKLQIVQEIRSRYWLHVTLKLDNCYTLWFFVVWFFLFNYSSWMIDIFKDFSDPCDPVTDTLTCFEGADAKLGWAAPRLVSSRAAVN